MNSDHNIINDANTSGIVEAASIAAFRNLGQPVAHWSADKQLLTYNPAFSRRFDCFQDRIPPNIDYKSFFDAVEKSGLLVQIFSGTEDDNVEEMSSQPTLFFSDGTVYRLDCWQSADGTSTTMCLDITTAHRNARALQKARDDATAADQSKSRFLRAANHDLRQPLAALKILIYSCISAETEDERRQALHAMDISVAIMEDLLGALLNIGQLDAGKVQPSIQTFQINTVLERLRVQFDHQAREKGLSLRILHSTTAVISDRVLLERVLSNLVSNAIRYTEVGRILVGCKRYGKTLRVSVYDTGCGIHPEHHEAIFEEFFRVADHQETRKHSLGLGLNISKRLADILELTIRLHSIPGRGSVFSVDLPIGNFWNSTIGETEINERIGGEFAGQTCLILEDDAHLRSALTSLLERWGIVVISFESFDDIAHSVSMLTHQPDIIISDYRLKGDVQGTDVVHQINDMLEKPCPAVVVTADTSPDLIASIRSQGFPVLIKPVSPPGLRVIMHNMLFEPQLVPENL